MDSFNWSDLNDWSKYISSLDEGSKGGINHIYGFCNPVAREQCT